MASSFDALGGGLDGEDESKKQERLAARAARFNKTLPGNKYKEVSQFVLHPLISTYYRTSADTRCTPSL